MMKIYEVIDFMEEKRKREKAHVDEMQKLFPGEPILQPSLEDFAKEHADYLIWEIELNGGFKDFPSHTKENILDKLWNDFYKEKLEELIEDSNR